MQSTMTPKDEEEGRDSFAETETRESKGNTNADASSADPLLNPSESENERPSLWKVVTLARPEFSLLGIAIFLMFCAQAIQLIVPLIIANVYDVIVEESEDQMEDINAFMSTVVVVSVIETFGNFLVEAILGLIGERIVARLRYQLYASILNQEIAFFDKHKSGELVSRMSSDTTLLEGMISNSIPAAMSGVIQTMVGICLMFWISPKLAVVSLSSVIVTFALAMPVGNLLGKMSKSYQDLLGQAQTLTTEAFGNIRTVHAFAAEEDELQRFGKTIGVPGNVCSRPEPNTTYRVGVRKSMTGAGFNSFIFGMGFVFLYVSLWYGFRLVNEGELSLGALTAFESYIFIIGFGLGEAASHFTQIFEGLGASGRVFYLLERVPAVPKKLPSSLNAPPTSLSGEIEFHNVTFSYPTRPESPVLEDFSLKFPSNSTTALVGSSGAGKSTVAGLLQRFYDVDLGKITVDGANIEDLPLKWFRRQIGYVPQEPQLFGRTIRENLLYGTDREISTEELERVCQDANAHDFIASFPHGYDTLIGERGTTLSGGQKQRIAIARALLTECRILLLDEATSALDSEAEGLVQEAMDRAVKNRTVLIIAHRLSTIQRADQIVVMSDHKIANVGTHDELLETSSQYRDWVERQSMATHGS